ncbi:MAG: hypothetical protein C0394_07350 [Syntrophus sp. (in: bacteria)]|nr:hypothetical protein [Syntrophus sp. (in: bacteria)]
MSSHVDEALTLLEQKKQAYDEFLAATKLLRQALESDDMADVFRFIERREALITQIVELDRRRNHHLQSVTYRHDAAILRRTAIISAELGERLREIISANQACDAVAAGRYEILRKDLAIMRQNEDGRHVYAGNAQGSPKFLSVRT